MAHSDNIWAFVSYADNCHRLSSHLHHCVAAYNARFHQHKTDAFFWNRSSDPFWTDMLATQSIDTYYTKFLPNPFRYLSYRSALTMQQRKMVDENSIETARSAISHYSQKSFSFHGKVTIVNTLILSKI